jgi:hypothetical protein
MLCNTPGPWHSENKGTLGFALIWPGPNAKKALVLGHYITVRNLSETFYINGIAGHSST